MLTQLLKECGDLRRERERITRRTNGADLVKEDIGVASVEYLRPIGENLDVVRYHAVDVQGDGRVDTPPGIQSRERVMHHSQGLTTTIHADVSANRLRLAQSPTMITVKTFGGHTGRSRRRCVG